MCIEQGLTETKQCPRGYVCENTITISINMMKICPDGFICPVGTNRIDLTTVGSGGNVQFCKDGYWCAEGSYSSIPDYGLFNSPQICRDEVVCYQGDKKDGVTFAGSNDQYGNSMCPRGHYCKDGIQTKCPAGFYCNEEQLVQPVPCPMGQYGT